MPPDVCIHCRGAEYVLEYWIEKILQENGIHMTELPKEVFKKIPVERLRYCHCNIRLALLAKNEIIRCLECEGTTWQFTEPAMESGYRWKKVANLTPENLRNLPCEYFERCPCGYDEKSYKPPHRKKALKEVFEIFKVRIPSISFGLAG